MIECIFAWVCIILALFKFEPMWAIASALFAISLSLDQMGKGVATMPECSEREAVLMEIENDYKNVEKIKTPFAQIVVGGSIEKPYYSIMWLDTASKDFNIGYSSYFLAYVRKWLEVVFEVTEAADVVAVVRCQECRKWHRHTQVNLEYGACYRHGVFPVITTNENDFCSYGERRGEDE